jgi:hypothetical protein
MVIMNLYYPEYVGWWRFLLLKKGGIMKKIFICCVLSFFLISQTGCGNKKEIQNARVKLELARKKIDLDQMYLVLKELKNLGDQEQDIDVELKKVEKAIPLLEKIKLNKSDHQHEEVVKAANNFLEYYPDHIEARKALKESGLIFTYLQQSINLLNGCFEYDNKTQEARLISTSTESKEVRIDYAKILNNIDKAEQYVKESKKLDPFFERALSLEKTICDTKNTIGIRLSDVVVITCATTIDDYMRLFSTVSRGLEASIESRYSSPQEYWKKASPILEKGRENDKPLLEELNQLSAYLDYFKESTISNSTMTVKEINIKLNTLVDAVVYPKGNVTDYRNSVRTIEAKIDELIAKYKSSSQNTEAASENIKGFGKALHDYQLFKTPEETKNILGKHKDLITI